MLTLKRVMQFVVVPVLATMALNGCSTAEVAPDASAMPEVPDYVKVPHPVGYEIAEIRALFESPLAPKGGLAGFADTCDQDFRTLAQVTQNKDERRQGASELVSMSAEKMHWCFYGKVERMQRNLKSEQSWAARQKIVLDAYDFLTPISMAFLSVYHDSRYLRWATQYYSNISEWIFFRKVVPGPENTLALTMSATTDLETWSTDKSKTDKKSSVFARYGIDLQQGMGAAEEAPAARQPAQAEPAPAAPSRVVTESPIEASDTADATADAAEHEAPAIDTLYTKPGFSTQVPDKPLAPIGNAKTRDPASVPAKKVPAKKPVKRKPQPAYQNETPFGL